MNLGLISLWLVLECFWGVPWIDLWFALRIKLFYPIKICESGSYIYSLLEMILFAMGIYFWLLWELFVSAIGIAFSLLW